jgi:hypothetical protein
MDKTEVLELSDTETILLSQDLASFILPATDGHGKPDANGKNAKLPAKGNDLFEPGHDVSFGGIGMELNEDIEFLEILDSFQSFGKRSRKAPQPVMDGRICVVNGYAALGEAGLFQSADSLTVEEQTIGDDPGDNTRLAGVVDRVLEIISQQRFSSAEDNLYDSQMFGLIKYGFDERCLHLLIL